VRGMGKALAAFVIGVLIALLAIGFAMHYGLIPRGIQIVGTTTGSSAAASSSGSVTYTGTSTASAYTGTGNSTVSGVVGTAVGYVFDRIGSYIVGSKGIVANFFNWLLGSSLADAVANLVVLIIVAGIVYWLMKFFKWIVFVVVAIDAVLIVLKYILMVI